MTRSRRALRDNNDMGDLLLFLVPFGLFVVVPVVAILTVHQRKMAEIIHRSPGREDVSSQVLERLDAMQREIAEIRHRQNETILALEDRRGSDLGQRVGD